MADWATDRPIYLDVVQTAGPVHEVPSVDQMAIKAAQSVAVMVGRMKGWREALYRKHPANVFVQPWPGQTSQGGLPNQAYSIGYYQLADNEALVFRIETGGAEYFSFQLSDIWGTSGNFVDHVSTLTNKQARAEADGSYTFVLTTRDPGHYNWISTQGWREGDVTLRWQGVAGTPRISVKKVTIAALAGELPQGSPSILAKHRQQQIAARTVNPYAKWMHAACAGQK
jgi:hypothetical protein